MKKIEITEYPNFFKQVAKERMEDIKKAHFDDIKLKEWLLNLANQESGMHHV